MKISNVPQTPIFPEKPVKTFSLDFPERSGFGVIYRLHLKHCLQIYYTLITKQTENVLFHAPHALQQWTKGSAEKLISVFVSHKIYMALGIHMLILEPPKYFIIILNIFDYINDNVTKSRSMIPMDLNIALDPYIFIPQATVDHHGASKYSDLCQQIQTKRQDNKNILLRRWQIYWMWY